MGASYWKLIGEKIAKGAGDKTLRRLGAGGKVLGRAGTVVGIGFLAYEFLKNYKDNIEKEPAYREMMILQAELEKWTSAISCLGREPVEEKDYGSFDEGGAINALYRKKTYQGPGTKDPDPKEAYALIGRSMIYIRQTENLAGDGRFEKKKKGLVSQLRKLQLQISKVDDYRPIQKKLGQIVDEIRPIANGYASRVYDCSREIQKTMGSNAAWAAISMTTLGLVKKPLSRRA
ncbi:hypothetical protein D1BOALGB6SA_9749 [Olavius sp. associated proteobacterium Delta 1]|nr:hypothetical protein D1BOALGB6SA_9749 [Olavius sp. associated proteobacterium Delta 1]